MKKLTHLILSSIVIIIAMLVVAVNVSQAAHADPDTQGSDATAEVESVCDPSVDPSCNDPALDCATNGSGDCGIVEKYVNPLVKFLAAFVGIAVTIGLAYGGIQYASAGSDPNAVSRARNTIKNSLIALIAFILLFAFTNWLLPGGIVGQTANTPSQPSPGGVSRGQPAAPPVAKPSPAITSLNGVDNFRDAGASGFITPGILYRSAKLQTAAPSQVASLLGNGTIIDLRTPSVISKSPDVSVPGVRTVNAPVNGTEDYTEFVTNSASRKGFNKAITAIANANGKVLIHCTYGKDRTGWVVAMTMYALGASDSQVMTEYLKSPDVSRDMLNAGLSQIRKEYGSIDNYLYKGIGLSSQTVDKLEQKLR